MALTSDPHAWLRPYFARLRSQSAFSQFSPQHQFEQLVQAVAIEHPSKAARMREWSTAAQHALLGHLAMTVDQRHHADQSKRWRVRKDGRELRCLVVYLPTGIDIRLMEGADFRRTALCRDPSAVETRSGEWRGKLLQTGWSLLDK